MVFAGKISWYGEGEMKMNFTNHIESDKLLKVCGGANGRKRICVACEDFEVEGFRLYPFSAIKNDNIDSVSNGSNTEFIYSGCLYCKPRPS